MRKLQLGIVCLAVSWACALPASAAGYWSTPFVTVTGGAGNAFGMFGAQGERYFRDGRVSAFAGLGYSTFTSDDPDITYPSGLAGAVGGRLYTSGKRHRPFVEASVSLLAAEWWSLEGGPVETARRYGPGLQLGYQFIARDGFTAVASFGGGYAVGAKADGFCLMGGIGLGYTWRRR